MSGSILGIGIDLVENKRITTVNNEGFINQVLTPNEQQLYNQKKGQKKLAFLCGRFAAKEAIIKAVSAYENPHMLEIEILNNAVGAPLVTFKDYHILVSIAHESKYTIAEAMLIKK